MKFGAVVSGPPIGFIIGRIGRKSSLMILSIPYVVGWLLIASAMNLNMLYSGRILTGM
jgi:predicted MFS family arabinose efflux permease